MRIVQDLTGKKINRLTVIELHERVIGKHAKWKCVCECGKETIVSIGNLNRGHTKSCGCAHFGFKKDFNKVVYPKGILNNWGISKQEYTSIHAWLRIHFGVERKCEHCPNENAKRYEWALKKGCKYERKRANFIRLCKSCHLKYDFTDSRRKKISNRMKLVKYAAKPVIKYDRNMNKISEYESITAASNSINRGITAITNNLSGLSQTCGGFIFKYKNS